MLQILRYDGIHVMNHQPRIDFIAGNTQITTTVSKYNLISYAQPFAGPVESLIDPAIEAESSLAYFAFDDEIGIALLERLKPPKLCISSSLHCGCGLGS